jgi:ATP-dependent RNA helicase RhlB
LIFTNRRDQTHQLNKYLNNRNIRCEPLAGDVPQRKRLSTLTRFKEGQIPYVVATDVAGRGIHVEGISHVINFDLPEDPEDYVHRIGRTGRAGAEGISISFVSEDDAFNLPNIEEFIGSPVVCTQPDI